MTLKENSKRTLDIVAGQDKLNATAAYMAVHPKSSAKAAASNAYKLMRNPEAQIYLEAHVSKARRKIVQLVESKKENIALLASQDILDRTHGKARQTTEVKASSIAFTIDLTGDDITPIIDPDNVAQ